MPDKDLVIKIPEPNERYPHGVRGCSIECPLWSTDEFSNQHCGAGLQEHRTRKRGHTIQLPGPKCPQYQGDLKHV